LYLLFRSPFLRIRSVLSHRLPSERIMKNLLAITAIAALGATASLAGT